MSQTTHILLEQADAIIQTLWRTHHTLGEPTVYVLLDGARNKNIHPLLDHSGLPFYCLIEGRLDYGMTLAAPYFMRLPKEAEFTRTLIQQAWGNSWGVFAIAYKPATLIKVREHCKSILNAFNGETGEKMFFRYYDPRVLCNYLPYCTVDDAHQFFGPISEFLFEKDLDQVIKHDLSQHFFRLTQSDQGIVDLNIITNEDNIKRIPIRPHLHIDNKLDIHPQQMAEFKKHRLAFFFKQMQSHLQDTFKETFTRLGDDKTQYKWVEKNVIKAKSFGFNDQQEICRYLNVAMEQGENFHTQTWAKNILDTHYQPTTKAMRLEITSIERIEEEHKKIESQLNKQIKDEIELFYLTHQAKVKQLGELLFGLTFKNTAELKAWLYSVGEQCVAYELFDDMEMDLWLDLSLQQGADFHQQPWAQSILQQTTLTPQAKLQCLLDTQPPSPTDSVTYIQPKDLLF